MQRKFSLKNLSTNQNQRIRLEAIDSATLEKFNEDYEFFEPMSSIDLCLSPNISQISCDGATSTCTIGTFTDGGYYSIKVNGVPFSNGDFMIGKDIFKYTSEDYEFDVENPEYFALKQSGLSAIALDEDFNQIIDDETHYYNGAMYIRFATQVSEPLRVEIECTDAEPMNTYIDPENPTVVATPQKVSFCLASVEVPTIGCEGAINDITVGYISDVGLLEVYVDDVKVESGGFMFRPDGLANALMGFDISVTPYDAQGNEITEANEPDRYYSVERARFQNMTNSFKQIRIEIIDANIVNTNYTPANSSFVFDEDTNITTFCLAPRRA